MNSWRSELLCQSLFIDSNRSQYRGLKTLPLPNIDRLSNFSDICGDFPLKTLNLIQYEDIMSSFAEFFQTQELLKLFELLHAFFENMSPLPSEESTNAIAGEGETDKVQPMTADKQHSDKAQSIVGSITEFADVLDEKLAVLYLCLSAFVDYCRVIPIHLFDIKLIENFLLLMSIDGYAGYAARKNDIQEMKKTMDSLDSIAKKNPSFKQLSEDYTNKVKSQLSSEDSRFSIIETVKSVSKVLNKTKWFQHRLQLTDTNFERLTKYKLLSHLPPECIDKLNKIYKKYPQKVKASAIEMNMAAEDTANVVEDIKKAVEENPEKMFEVVRLLQHATNMRKELDIPKDPKENMKDFFLRPSSETAQPSQIKTIAATVAKMMSGTKPDSE